MDPSRVLRYQQPLPAGPLLEGLIIDDYVCLLIQPSRVPLSPASPDAQCMAAASRAYKQACLEEASEKEVLQSPSFTVWGTSIDSDLGTVASPHRSSTGPLQARPSRRALGLPFRRFV